MEERKIVVYEKPSIVTYSNEDILEELGPAQACTPSPQTCSPTP